MKKSTVILIAALMVGCSTQQNATKAFYAQEDEVARVCMAPVFQLPAERRLEVDRVTGRSPFSNAAWCYSNQIKTAVRITGYAHTPLVTEYADYLTRLTAAHDQGVISAPVAMGAYQQTSVLFRQSIANADSRLEAQSRRDLAGKIAAFAVAMSAVAAEQGRQQALNRPVVCTLTGVYVQNTIVCN